MLHITFNGRIEVDSYSLFYARYQCSNKYTVIGIVDNVSLSLLHLHDTKGTTIDKSRSTLWRCGNYFYLLISVKFGAPGYIELALWTSYYIYPTPLLVSSGLYRNCKKVSGINNRSISLFSFFSQVTLPFFHGTTDNKNRSIPLFSFHSRKLLPPLYGITGINNRSISLFFFILVRNYTFSQYINKKKTLQSVLLCIYTTFVSVLRSLLPWALKFPVSEVSRHAESLLPP